MPVASATTELITDFQLSLTRQRFLILSFRALKDTAQLILSLRDTKGIFYEKALLSQFGFRVFFIFHFAFLILH